MPLKREETAWAGKGGGGESPRWRGVAQQGAPAPPKAAPAVEAPQSSRSSSRSQMGVYERQKGLLGEAVLTLIQNTVVLQVGEARLAPRGERFDWVQQLILSVTKAALGQQLPGVLRPHRGIGALPAAWPGLQGAKETTKTMVTIYFSGGPRCWGASAWRAMRSLPPRKRAACVNPK